MFELKYFPLFCLIMFIIVIISVAIGLVTLAIHDKLEQKRDAKKAAEKAKKDKDNALFKNVSWFCECYLHVDSPLRNADLGNLNTLQAILEAVRDCHNEYPWILSLEDDFFRGLEEGLAAYIDAHTSKTVKFVRRLRSWLADLINEIAHRESAVEEG